MTAATSQDTAQAWSVRVAEDAAWVADLINTSGRKAS